jgi:hypothetical protein
MEVIGPEHPDYDAWYAELPPDVRQRREGGAAPFIRPTLPERFGLADAQCPSNLDGPFSLAEVVTEPDGAMVFLTAGLPYRIGVVAQTGSVLTLHDGSVTNVVPWPSEASDTMNARRHIRAGNGTERSPKPTKGPRRTQNGLTNPEVPGRVIKGRGGTPVTPLFGEARSIRRRH